MADAAQIGYPANATLDKDSGFQGYESVKKTEGRSPIEDTPYE
jgi:hypothetical protein